MTNPLLQKNDARARTVEQLADVHAELLKAIENYREAWKKAREIGWATTDLTRTGGFTNPNKLPRPKHPMSTEASITPSNSAGADPLD